MTPLKRLATIDAAQQRGDDMTLQLGKTAKAWSKAAGWLALPLTLTACAGGGGEVVKMDERTYMVVSSSRWQGNMGVAATGLKQADAYCKGLGRQMVMTGAETSDGFIGVWPPKAVIMFRCDAVRGKAAPASSAPDATPQAASPATASTGAVVTPIAPVSSPSAQP